MADKRINALANTAPSTASDDFIAVDGTTNGTRKLSAFSPTFGGNATVTGTLTVNSTSTLTGATVIGGDSSNGNYLSYNTDISGFCGLWMRQSTKSATNYVLASNGTSGTLVNSTGASLFLRVENTTALEINTSRNVLIPTTTASTSTSSGALVVSGGVGVAGNVWTGGQVNLAATSVEASTGINFGVANATSRDIVFFGDGTRGGMLRGYHDGSNSARLGFGYWASSGDTYTSVIDITGSATTSSQLVAIAGTAGSTSTTSGALTVAGGMGVAEAVNAGTFYGLVDGVTAPATESGYARIYVDSADGDLKVKFGDGTVKTIATDS